MKKNILTAAAVVSVIIGIVFMVLSFIDTGSRYHTIAMAFICIGQLLNLPNMRDRMCRCKDK